MEREGEHVLEIHSIARVLARVYGQWLPLSLPSTEFPYIDGLMARRCPRSLSRSVCACWLAGGYAELCTRNRPLGNVENIDWLRTNL